MNAPRAPQSQPERRDTVGIGAFGYLALRATSEADRNKAIAVSIVQHPSNSWNLSEIESLIQADALAQFRSEQARSAFQNLSRLGRLEDAREAAQTHYNVLAGQGAVATIQFEGQLENGSSSVRVVLGSERGTMKLINLNIGEVQFSLVERKVRT